MLRAGGTRSRQPPAASVPPRRTVSWTRCSCARSVRCTVLHGPTRRPRGGDHEWHLGERRCIQTPFLSMRKKDGYCSSVGRWEHLVLPALVLGLWARSCVAVGIGAEGFSLSCTRGLSTPSARPAAPRVNVGSTWGFSRRLGEPFRNTPRSSAPRRRGRQRAVPAPVSPRGWWWWWAAFGGKTLEGA